MSTALQPFNPANLAVALKKMARTSASSGAFLKMEKTGAWVFGINAEELPEGAEFYVHPSGFVHGYVAWEADQGGTKLGEIMGPLGEEIPPTGPVPEGGDGWQFQLGLALLGVEDRSPLLYRATSVGGKRAIAQLGGEIAVRLDAKDKQCVPVVTLSSESYKHKKYGKIFNPIITIERWTTLAEVDEEQEPAPPVKANGKTRAAPVKAPVKTPAAKAPPMKAPAKAPAKTPVRRAI